jgi:hypothetical protein
LGILLFRRRSGACPALRWDERAIRYQCGALSMPYSVARDALPDLLVFAAPLLGLLLRSLAPRWIAAGVGCDSHIEQSPTSRSSPEPE